MRPEICERCLWHREDIERLPVHFVVTWMCLRCGISLSVPVKRRERQQRVWLEMKKRGLEKAMRMLRNKERRELLEFVGETAVPDECEYYAEQMMGEWNK